MYNLGTPGAHTACHYDSYGYNVHAQLSGSKRWILFEPSENMEPVRIPYEESTIFRFKSLYLFVSCYLQGNSFFEFSNDLRKIAYCSRKWKSKCTEINRPL